MIKVTRLNGKNFMLNAEIIETLEETPDTVITLVDGKKYVVKESLFKRDQYWSTHIIFRIIPAINIQFKF